MTAVHCFKCGWDGEEAELIERPGNLMFYDYMAQNTLGVEVSRVNQECPKCGEMLKSHRMVNGMVFDQMG